MMKLETVNKLILIFTGYLAALQIVSGVEKYSFIVMVYLTISFGVILLACLLLILFDFEFLKNFYVRVSVIFVPLGFASSLIATHCPNIHLLYIVLIAVGLMLILIAKYLLKDKIVTLGLTTIHTIAVMIIFALPAWFILTGLALPMYFFVSIGGAVIGFGGISLLTFNPERKLLTDRQIYKMIPSLLLFVTASIIVGLSVN